MKHNERDNTKYFVFVLKAMEILLEIRKLGYGDN